MYLVTLTIVVVAVIEVDLVDLEHFVFEKTMVVAVVIAENLYLDLYWLGKPFVVVASTAVAVATNVDRCCQIAGILKDMYTMNIVNFDNYNFLRPRRLNRPVFD